MAEDNSNNTQQEEVHTPIKQKNKTGFYYSFLTLVLLFCLIQIGFGAILNISKTISYRAKISTLTKIRDSAENQNRISNCFHLPKALKVLQETTLKWLEKMKFWY